MLIASIGEGRSIATETIIGISLIIELSNLIQALEQSAIEEGNGAKELQHLSLTDTKELRVAIERLDVASIRSRSEGSCTDLAIKRSKKEILKDGIIVAP